MELSEYLQGLFHEMGRASERVHRLCEFLVFEARLPSTPLMFLWQQIGC
jgi:hypothetical protein